MNHPFNVLRMLGVLLFCLIGTPGGQGADQPRATPTPDPSFEQIKDVPGLPRVLLIGDSISVGYTVPVRELLKGKANVHRIPANAATTRNTLDQFKNWIQAEQWDVIHFNWGLHDIKRMADGKPQVGPADYEQNLKELIQRLRPMSRKLIWCSTTPVPGTDLEPPRFNKDVVAYNAIARRVMAESHIPVNDLYAFAFPQADRIRKPLNVHFTPKGCQVLAQQVTQCIEQAIALE